MPLTLYRRHRKECEGKHPEDSRSGEFEEGRRGWKKCGCLIHASGTLGGAFNRKQTGKSQWRDAHSVAAQWEAANSWLTSSSDPIPVRAPSIEARITIKDATDAFIASRRNREIAA